MTDASAALEEANAAANHGSEPATDDIDVRSPGDDVQAELQRAVALATDFQGRGDGAAGAAVGADPQLRANADAVAEMLSHDDASAGGGAGTGAESGAALLAAAARVDGQDLGGTVPPSAVPPLKLGRLPNNAVANAMTKAGDQPLLTDDPDVLGFVSARSYSSSVTSGWGRRRRRMQPARHMPLYGAGGGAALVSSRVGTARSSAASGGGGSALVVHSSRSMRAKM